MQNYFESLLMMKKKAQAVKMKMMVLVLSSTIKHLAMKVGLML